MANDAQVTDEQVLTDPDAFTVAEVLDVFSRSAPEQIAEAKALEAEGQNRKGIADYTPPAPEPPAEQPVYSRERVLSPTEGPLIADATYPVIAGALDGDDRTEFTRAEVRERITAFLGRTVHQEG